MKNKKRPRGRPRKYTPNQYESLAKAFEEYIEDERNVIPIVAEFCSKQKIIKQTLYDHPEYFSTLLKRCIEKKEARLERLCLQNKINPSMAIFSLKQLGWTDKQEFLTPPGEDNGKFVIEVVHTTEQPTPKSDKKEK